MGQKGSLTDTCSSKIYLSHLWASFSCVEICARNRLLFFRNGGIIFVKSILLIKQLFLGLLNLNLWQKLVDSLLLNVYGLVINLGVLHLHRRRPHLIWLLVVAVIKLMIIFPDHGPRVILI